MNISAKKEICGKIKPLHGVGKPPMYFMNFSYFHYLKDAGIPFSRLHDVGAFISGGGFVDIPFVFPDFNANPYDPASYDFAFTDKLMEALSENGVEPIFRLGVTIENYAYIKAYNIYPPKDNLQWARICEGIIRHYNCGWANGYHYGIRYWEIWNEPDNSDNKKFLNQMWLGTDEQYFELYETASKHLKERFPDIKIGGYGSCGFLGLYIEKDNDFYDCSQYYIDYFNRFLSFVKKTGSPFDFFSWHNYNGPEEISMCAKYARKRLDEEGFEHTETSLNEWHCSPQERGSAHHCAVNTAILLALQDLPVDTAAFYDARLGISMYGGLFNPLTHEPFKLYYGFKAFNELFIRKDQVKIQLSEKGVYAVCAKGEDDFCLLISNTNGSEIPLSLNISNIVSCREISEDRTYEATEFKNVIGANTVLEIIFK